MAARNEEAQLLKQYAPVVAQIVGGFQRRLPRNVLRDDLMAAAMTGLWDAIRKQSGNFGEGFECYLRVRIRGAILDELRSQDWLPRRARAAASVAEGAGSPCVVRMEDLGSLGRSRALGESEEADGESTLLTKCTREALERAICTLPGREQLIVSRHYFGGAKFKEIGEQLGVSEPRISQLHSRAMQRLRDAVGEV